MCAITQVALITLYICAASAACLHTPSVRSELHVSCHTDALTKNCCASVVLTAVICAARAISNSTYRFSLTGISSETVTRFTVFSVQVCAHHVQIREYHPNVYNI